MRTSTVNFNLFKTQGDPRTTEDVKIIFYSLYFDFIPLINSGLLYN